MIPRYEKKEISEIWNDHSKFSYYLQAELAVMKALEGKLVPEGLSAEIAKTAKINPTRIDEIEAVTKHDVIAFCTSITENLSAEKGKYFHFGVTSSDIIDTALTLQIKASLEVIIPAYQELLRSLFDRAHELKDVVTMGRSHGMFAEPMSFGQKLLGHYNELSRRFKELQDFHKEELTVQFSGAVGNYTIVTPEIESAAAAELNLKVEPLSTQVIPRDRIAKLVNIGAMIGTAIERMAVEIRHLHRSDVGELYEGFSKGQKGSSIMPHKKNPISGENLTGMARMLRSHTVMAMENIVLWHERDISHSSTERMYLPDHFGILYYSITRLNSTLKNMVFNVEKIEQRVQAECHYLSSYYLHQLIKSSDIKREELYYFVQEAAFHGEQTKSAAAMGEKLNQILKEKNISLDFPVPNFSEIKKIYLGSVDKVFQRSLKEYPLP